MISNTCLLKTQCKLILTRKLYKFNIIYLPVFLNILYNKLLFLISLILYILLWSNLYRNTSSNPSCKFDPNDVHCLKCLLLQSRTVRSQNIEDIKAPILHFESTIFIFCFVKTKSKHLNKYFQHVSLHLCFDSEINSQKYYDKFIHLQNANLLTNLIFLKIMLINQSYGWTSIL